MQHKVFYGHGKITKFMQAKINRFTFLFKRSNEKHMETNTAKSVYRVKEFTFEQQHMNHE
jgi:hypothetical protein